jgi:hypothetical protein
LAHHAYRVALSNRRRVAITGENVVFQYRDPRDRGLRRIRRFGWWGNAVRTEKLALLRRLLDVPPAAPDDAALPTHGEADAEQLPEEPPDQELAHLEAEQRAPHKCRACGGKLVLLYQTERPTVADLLRMPPTMEILVETGPLQLHLPLSAFL